MPSLPMPDRKDLLSIPPAARNWTFAQWRDYLNSFRSGMGDEFIAWVNNNVQPPLHLTDLNTKTLGEVSFFPYHPNTAAAWVGAWLFSQVQAGIAREIRNGIRFGANQVPTAAAGVGAGIHDLTSGVPGLSGIGAIGDFFTRLTEGSTWIRIGEVLIGATLLAIGVNALLKNNDTYQATVRSGKKIAKVTTPQGKLFK